MKSIFKAVRKIRELKVHVAKLKQYIVVLVKSIGILKNRLDKIQELGKKYPDEEIGKEILTILEGDSG